MRYWGLLGIQLRASLIMAMQYRADFLLEGFVESFWTLTALVPLVVVFRERSTVAGWSFGECLIVMGWFTFLQGVLEGAINPSLAAVVEHIRKGTLDFVLVKPADAQFLVSTARIQPWRAMNILMATAIFVWGFRKLGRWPGAAAVVEAGAAMGIAVIVLYSLWIITVSASFYVVRINNLSYLFNAIFDAARWPVSVFRGALRAIFTFVIPLALMTTFPAQALLGTLRFETLLASLAGAALVFALARGVWLLSLARYTSAGG